MNITELFDLRGKTALVTGASSGLGERFSQVLVQAGARVILAARRLDKLKVMSDSLNEKGFSALPLEMDVSNKDSVRKAFEQLREKEERIDICVNNAGIGKSTPIFDKTDSDKFEANMQTNVLGIWYVTKEVANHMKDHGIEGSIINIASINGADVPAFGAAGYCASKAAVLQLTKALVGELAKYKIRINSISPGIFQTQMTAESIKANQGHILQKTPLNFIADPKDLDGILLYLASNKASRYVTGSCNTVDGGVSWGGWT
mgnify:CR=1 FL=1